jgi:hypothetical protein
LNAINELMLIISDEIILVFLYKKLTHGITKLKLLGLKFHCFQNGSANIYVHAYSACLMMNIQLCVSACTYLWREIKQKRQL